MTIEPHVDVVRQEQVAATPAALEEAIKSRTARPGIIGLGYVGLPLVRAFVEARYRTIGFDVDPGKIEQLEVGRSYVGHIASAWIGECVRAGKFVPTSDMSRLAEPDAIIICVPTPLTQNREPDLSYVENTARTIAQFMRPGQLIVLESTTYPGTTRNVLLPILESSGFSAGDDFFLAYSPEREDPGNPNYTAANIPKVVGGIDRASTHLACELYSRVVRQVVPVSSCEVAEACKILENTYRAVNIALVNEMKQILHSMGIDIWEVIEAASTKPFGFQPFYPGPGLGGHCIPIDPFYLAWVAREFGVTTRFIELAGEVNSSMPRFVLGRVIDALNEAGKPLRGSKVCLLGVAYKKDIDDPRESPAFELMKLLMERGAELSYNDPHIPTLPRMRHYDPPPMNSVELTPEFLAAQDVVLIVTDHSAYDWDYIVEHAQLIVDTRNATRAVRHGRNKIYKA